MSRAWFFWVFGRSGGGARRMLSRLLVAALLLGGCSLAPQRPAPLVPEDLLWQALAVQQGRFSSWRGMARIQLESPAGSQRTNQLVVVEEPDRFRAEVLSMFGQPLLSMASDGRVLSVSIPGSGEFYRGAPTAANLYRFIRLPLAVDDLVGLLLHDVPLLDYRHSRALPGPALALSGVDGSRQLLEFDGQLRLVAARYLDPSGSVWLQVVYDEFPDSPTGLPKRIAIALPQAGQDLQIELSELELNPELKAEMFELVAPPGVPIKPFP